MITSILNASFKTSFALKKTFANNYMHIMFTFTVVFCSFALQQIIVSLWKVKIILYLHNCCLFSPPTHWQWSLKHIPVYVQFHKSQDSENKSLSSVSSAVLPESCTCSKTLPKVSEQIPTGYRVWSRAEGPSACRPSSRYERVAQNVLLVYLLYRIPPAYCLNLNV